MYNAQLKKILNIGHDVVFERIRREYPKSKISDIDDKCHVHV